MALLSTLVHLVESAGPEAMPDGFVGVFDKALVKKERPGKAAMNNGGLSTAFQYGAMPLKLSMASALGKSSRREPNAARSRAL